MMMDKGKAEDLIVLQGKDITKQKSTNLYVPMQLQNMLFILLMLYV